MRKRHKVRQYWVKYYFSHINNLQTSNVSNKYFFNISPTNILKFHRFSQNCDDFQLKGKHLSLKNIFISMKYEISMQSPGRPEE